LPTGMSHAHVHISEEGVFLIAHPPTGEWIGWGFQKDTPLSDMEKRQLPREALDQDGTDIQHPVEGQTPPAKLPGDHEKPLEFGNTVPRIVMVGHLRTYPLKEWANKTVEFVYSPSRGIAWVKDQDTGTVLHAWKPDRWAPEDRREHVPIEVDVYPGGTIATIDPAIRLHVGNHHKVVIESNQAWVTVRTRDGATLVHQRWTSLQRGTVEEDETAVLRPNDVTPTQTLINVDDHQHAVYVDPNGREWRALIGRHHKQVIVGQDPHNNVVFLDPANRRVLARPADGPQHAPEGSPPPQPQSDAAEPSQPAPQPVIDLTGWQRDVIVDQDHEFRFGWTSPDGLTFAEGSDDQVIGFFHRTTESDPWQEGLPSHQHPQNEPGLEY
jgi:hypothetical protein